MRTVTLNPKTKLTLERRTNPTILLDLRVGTLLEEEEEEELYWTVNRNICAHIVDTHNKFFPELIKGIFSADA